MSIKYLQTNYFCQASSAVTFTVQLQASSLAEAADYVSLLEGQIAVMNTPIVEAGPPPVTPTKVFVGARKKKAASRKR